MRTARGFDRLVNFSDAVVAIAMTLLVLPLVDIARQAPSSESIGEVLDGHTYELFAFGLSFVVIGVMWRAHHALFEHLQSYDSVVLRLNEVWLFTIIVLPFTTELLNRNQAASAANGLYVGTLLVSSGTLAAITEWVKRHPELRHPDSAVDHDNRIDGLSWITTGLLAVAFVVVVLVPRLNMWPMLLLFLEQPIRALLGRHRDRAAEATT